MNFDDLKIIWNEENAGRSYTIDEDALHRIAVKRARSFRKKVFWREIAIDLIRVDFPPALGPVIMILLGRLFPIVKLFLMNNL